MTALPDWMTHTLTADDYEALPEEICRQIEIVDGNIVLSPSPRRDHQDVVVELTHALKAAAKPAFRASCDVDLRLRDVPLLNRRPDVVIYDASLPDKDTLRPEHCLLVVEVMSPGSVTTDRLDKPAEYAAAGIEHVWRVELDTDGTRILYRFALDWTATKPTYTLVGKDTGLVTVTEPLALALDLDALR